MDSEPRRPIVAFISLLCILLLIGFLVFREFGMKKPEQLPVTTAGYVEMCLFCHADQKLDPAHDAQVMGCSPCHLGDPLVNDKEKAHKDMVLNPGDLRVAHKTCGIEGCHSQDVHKVKNSLMATNRGILATLRYYWGEADNQYGKFSVREVEQSGETSLALDYYRKLCASCHLWKQKNDLPDAPEFYKQKGGGCAACHYVIPEIPDNDSASSKTASSDPPGERPKKPHPLIIKKVPDDNCIRCHNRSGRIGLSYTGRFESEGYGTPYEQGDLSSRKLAGGGFYLEIAEDAHHAKGMACIDCHTRDEIMGDGNNYAHYEDQLEISCEACHAEEPGVTRKDRKMVNIVRQDDKFVLIGKLDQKERPLNLPQKEACLYPGHKRVTCEACHSTWVPQCYGCHVHRDDSDTHLDKLTLRETKGWWQEGRSYIRHEKPMLAVWGNEIVIVTPGCQDVVTLSNEDGEMVGGFNRFTMAAINPHTTARKGRACVECHASPKTVGLGEGILWQQDGEWRFSPLDQGVDTWNGKTVGLDQFVTIDGEPLQKASRSNLRPFNGSELWRILRVGLCLECHREYSDPAYRDYNPERPCPVYREP